MTRPSSSPRRRILTRKRQHRWRTTAASHEPRDFRLDTLSRPFDSDRVRDANDDDDGASRDAHFGFAKSTATAAVLGLAAFVTPVIAPTHAHASNAAITTVQASPPTVDENLRLLKLPKLVRDKVEEGLHELSDIVCATGDELVRRINVDWSIEDMWLLLFWNAAITKGRRVIYRALALSLIHI